MANNTKIPKEITKLFKARDRAVKNNDLKLFSSTQLREIENSSSRGYISNEEMKSKIITGQKLNSVTYKIAVKEKYYKNNKLSHTGLLFYFIVNTQIGWKIFDILW